MKPEYADYKRIVALREDMRNYKGGRNE